MWQSKLKAAGVALVKLMCAVIVFFSFVFTSYAVGPAFETKYNPVVSKLEITSMRQLSDGRTEIRAAFRKLRNCEYIGLAWYVGTRPDRFERVPVTLMRDQDDTGSPNRPVGYQSVGPWIIGLSIDDLRGHSFAQLVHRCHPFWNTITDFFP